MHKKNLIYEKSFLSLEILLESMLKRSLFKSPLSSEPFFLSCFFFFLLVSASSVLVVSALSLADFLSSLTSPFSVLSKSPTVRFKSVEMVSIFLITSLIFFFDLPNDFSALLQKVVANKNATEITNKNKNEPRMPNVSETFAKSIVSRQYASKCLEKFHIWFF